MLLPFFYFFDSEAIDHIIFLDRLIIGDISTTFTANLLLTMPVVPTYVRIVVGCCQEYTAVTMLITGSGQNDLEKVALLSVGCEEWFSFKRLYVEFFTVYT
jgi:hypothetical protein